MLPIGRGMFIWQMARCGTPEYIAEQALLYGGFEHVLTKVADGTDLYNPGVEKLNAALKSVNIQPLVWQYVYLYDPRGEAITAVEQVKNTGAVGFVMDVEAHCKDKPEETKLYCDTLKSLLPADISIGFSSYRYPRYHPEISWDTWRAISDYDMPQVYWMQEHNPAEQLIWSYEAYTSFERKLPYIPTGAAFTEYGWKPTPADVYTFIDTCRNLSLNAFNFWEWYAAKYTCPELWQPVCSYPVEPVLPKDTLRMKALVNGQYIRSGPGAAYPVVGSLIAGQVVNVTDVAGMDAWAEIAPGKWAAIKFLTKKYLDVV